MSGSDQEDGDVAGQAEKGNSDNADNMENPSNMDIVKAIRTFKQEFRDEMEGVLVAIKNVQKDVKECNGRITEAQQPILQPKMIQISYKELWENLKKRLNCSLTRWIT